MSELSSGGDVLLGQLERRGDGRNVDGALGALVGEGAQQRVKDTDVAYPVERGPVLRRPTEAVAAEEPSPTYYGQPVLKQPVWVWAIPVYFHVGGMAGTSALLGFTAEVAGRGRLERLSRQCHWVSAVGDAASAGLLILELGRPERFLNMMRVFRPTSPMNVGAWVLAACGGASATTIVLRNQHGPLLDPWRRLASGASAVMGIPLVGYTAVLLSNTSVPVWQHTRRALPMLFMSSAAASTASFLQLFPKGRRERRVLRSFKIVGMVGSLAASLAVEAEAARSGAVVRPLRQGATSLLWRAFQACTVAGLAASLLPGHRGFGRRIAANVLAHAGALAMRFAVFHAGKASARDPRATFEGQRQGLGAASVTGASQVLRDWKPEKFALPVVR